MTAISYQLYSSRNFGPIEKTLTMLAAKGYRNVEGYAGLYDDVPTLRAALDSAGLAMPTGHFSIAMLEDEPDTALDIAHQLGMKRIYCPYLTPDERPTDKDGWSALGARLAAAGAPFTAAGLGFGWHNHDFEFAALKDGSIPQELMFAAAPDLEWEADIAWIVRGGADPMEWIKRHGHRITSAHVKDIAVAGENTNEDGWADVGHGRIDWQAIALALKATPVKYLIVEHDNPSDDARFAENSLATVQSF